MTYCPNCSCGRAIVDKPRGRLHELPITFDEEGTYIVPAGICRRQATKAIKLLEEGKLNKPTESLIFED